MFLVSLEELGKEFSWRDEKTVVCVKTVPEDLMIRIWNLDQNLIVALLILAAYNVLL